VTENEARGDRRQATSGPVEHAVRTTAIRSSSPDPGREGTKPCRSKANVPTNVTAAIATSMRSRDLGRAAKSLWRVAVDDITL
jgi:hypothetical protein